MSAMSYAQETLERYWERIFREADGRLTAREFLDERDLARVGELEEEPRDASAARRHAARLASAIAHGDVTDVERELMEDDALRGLADADADVSFLLVLALAFGVAAGSGACANYLGALFYLGSVVEPDYARAKRLYEIAERRGSVRAIVNLGYIYEYGRLGKPDHLAAYLQYAKACALTGDYEALYKLGDMYARGMVVEPDLMVAFTLYCKSFDAAAGEVEQAQAAFRIAELIGDAANEAIWDIPFDPMGALRLYQLAERGLRVDIAHGQTYYDKRLAQSIVGQERMRELIDSGACEL